MLNLFLAAALLQEPARIPQEPASWDEASARAWIEAEGPLMPRLTLLDADGRDTAARALAAAARLPVDWMEVLADPVMGRSLARRLAYDGLPQETRTDALLDGLAAADAGVQALVAAAALVPQRVGGRPPASGALRTRVVGILAGHLIGNQDQEDTALLFARVRPYTGAAQIEAAARGLQGAGPLNRRHALSLLLGAPFRLARPRLLDLVLDPLLPSQERGRLAEQLVLGGGRAGLEPLLAILGPDTPDDLFRRMLVLWQDHVQPQDLALLAALARTGPELGRPLALQLWARNERDPARRLEVFELILEEPVRYQAPGMDSLARQGRHREIARRLLAALDGADRSRQLLALAALPAFMPPEELLAAYEARVDSEAGRRERGRWAAVLSQLGVPEASAAAAAWLAGDDAKDPVTERRVAVTLEGSPEIDPWLARLLFESDISEESRMHLALARAPHSPDALEYLRQQVLTGSGVTLTQAVEALARAGEQGDILLMADLARDPDTDPTARAAAVRGLAQRPDAGHWLLELLATPPRSYEVAEALVAGVIRHGDDELRAEALAAARAGMRRLDPDERAGLLRAAWRAQALEPRPAEAAALGAQLLALLEELPDRDEEPLIVDSRRLTMEYPEVELCSRALASCARGDAPDLLLRWDSSRVHAGPLLFSANLIARALPTVAAGWCRQAAGRPALHPGARIRALAGWARAAEGVSASERAAALRALLERPWELRANTWDLEIGLAGALVRQWVLAGDRLHEFLVLAEAQEMRADSRLQSLATLLEGDADPVVLQDASEMALGTPGGLGLGVALAWRASDWDPTSPGPRLQLGRALELAGQPEALRIWREAAAHPLASEEQRQIARRGVERLEEAGGE